MDAMKVEGWILLSVARAETGSLQQILRAADEINHALPTLDELRTSLGWLKAQGLVSREGDCFVPTVQGRAVVEAITDESKFVVWDLLSARLSRCPHTVAEPEALEREQVIEADEAYRRQFWRNYRELRSKDP